MAIYLLLILLSVVIFHIVLNYSERGRHYNKIPGYIPIPLLGNMLSVNLTHEKLWQLFRKVAEDNDIFRLWFVIGALVVTRHPDDIKVLLSSRENIDKTYAYENLQFFAGTGLPISERSIWKQRRKIVNPAFSVAMIRLNFEIVDDYTRKFVQDIKSEGNETIQSVLTLFKKLAISIICDVTMGVDIRKCEVQGADKFMNSLDVSTKVTLYRVTRPYIKNWMMKFLPMGRKQIRSIVEGHIFRDKIIEERRKNLEQTGYESYQKFVDNFEADNTSTDMNKRQRVLDILLLAEKNGLIDCKGVGDEVTAFIATGYDTTALTVAYTLMVLAENPEAQKLARNEVLQICSQNKNNNKITYAATEQFEYLERCIKESLRLFPIVPGIMRNNCEGLQFRDYYIPPKTDLVVDIFDLHRDPNYWPNPEKFDPDRFLPELVKARHPFAYIPFSAGIRNCIGLKYGMMSLKTILANVLRNFYLEPVERTADFEFMMDVTLHHKQPMNVKFVTINHDKK